MFDRKRRTLPAVVAGALGLGGMVAPVALAADPAAGPSQQELMQQIKALQAKVEQLETKQQNQQDKLDARAVDATIDRVLKDAGERSQLLQSEGFTAGYNNGKFLIQSADGKFSLNPNVQLQFRYVSTFREESKNIGSDDWQDGFEVRRLKFALEGNVFDKNTTYKFQWATGRANGQFVLEEAFVQHMFGESVFGVPAKGFGIKAGQFKDPTFHEEILSSKRQLAVERSLANEYLAGGITDYEQGVALVYQGDDRDPIRGEIGYIDGGNTDNTNFTNSGGYGVLSQPNAQFGAYGRFEYKVAGTWKQYADFTAMGNKEDLLVVGGGINYTQGQGGDAYLHTVDAQWEPQAVQGLSVYGAYYGILRDFREVDDGEESSPYDWGFVAQAGLMLTNDVEVFGRYSYISLEDGAPAGNNTLGAAAAIEDSVHEITIGLNYYLKSHASKVTVDFSWLPNGSPLDQNGAGVLAQPNGDNQFVFRAQYQLLL